MNQVDRLDSLTDEQLARMPEWRDKWVEIGLRTGPADRATFEQAARDCYRLSGLPEPESFIWVDSPLAMARTATELIQASAHPDKKNWTWRNYLGGQFWVGGWYWGSPSYVSYCTDVCGLRLAGDIAERAIAYRRTCESACWWCPFDTAVVVSERPIAIHRDAQGRLHSERSMAIEWPDGFGLYRMHGITVPEWLVINPHQLSVERIDAEKNAEVRRIMIDLMGPGRFVREAKAQIVHTDEYGTLYSRKFEDGSVAKIAHVKNSTPEANGTHREFWLRVHPELRPLLGGGQLGDPQGDTCRNAVASTYGLRGDEYAPEVET